MLDNSSKNVECIRVPSEFIDCFSVAYFSLYAQCLSFVVRSTLAEHNMCVPGLMCDSNCHYKRQRNTYGFTVCNGIYFIQQMFNLIRPNNFQCLLATYNFAVLNN